MSTTAHPGSPVVRHPATGDSPAWRDLNGNGVLDPYEDPRLPVEERVEDLLGRLSLEEKVGLMFHTVIEAGPDGGLLEGPGAISKSATSEVVLGKHLSHFNVHELRDARQAARWSNALQRLAERTPHGIPVTVSSDPRHAFIDNAGVSFAAGAFSQWPEPLGLAALRDRDAVRRFADIVRQEYRAVGIREALHPTLDLATEPRWGRQAGTFGQDPTLVGDLGVAYLEGLQQGPELGPDAVACVTKHFPGGGPQQDGEDAHFPYGREQVYPGGRFADHLAPFPRAIEAGTAAVMPYYGMPVGLELDGEPVEAVGFGYNRQIVTGLLRERLGFDGVVLTDWELVNDNHVGDQVLPARAWGVEHLDPAGRMELLLHAGADQLGGEECVEVLLDLVRSGRVPQSRVEESARRLLRVKFRLGLFDDPFVDEDAAVALVGNGTFRRAGLEAQARSVTVLRTEEVGGRPALPLLPGTRVYAERVSPEALTRHGLVPVSTPAEADLALVRLAAPFEHRDDLFLEAWFHQGSLDFPPGLVTRMERVAAHCPLVLDVTLDRPAVLTPLVPLCAALTATYGTSEEALLAALTGKVEPVGRLPFDLPVSMEAVRRHPEDVPGLGDQALFRCGDGGGPVSV
ncbi:glycoside hydrolase family 3 protein [Phycicoccus endophyticus]|uniref:beta-glucosidase n=1 Tax=Phycicoccus endophyticus TaxID=1690220 RepID=A0A7G9R0M6_9MICO|nr:glycoside hydrolase family 3 protein [Phycicoccus endophyticus]NHI19432.1 glycoside hydrolase family 3 protein [Phycicoccus endophyticus]QNN49151.1 glycoside hydrolase family 3 protein [Phycicoccus endophyticus]GGL39156.1 beta-glucosidase [Phycicoccus endophyticus]